MTPPTSVDDCTAMLEVIQRRVLWLAVQQIHYANRVRLKSDEMKVGGHQASCASVVTIMTTLYFRYLRSGDLISMKPHASPVLHAMEYLLGNLDESYLKRLRDLHGLQAYPTRTKDPDRIDFTTGSVGLGAVAPNFAALVETYLRTHGLESADEQRFISLVGDAELDEGSVWEAIAEPAMAGIRNVLWIVDVNRQSLDRVIPGIRVRCWREMFAANGWEVIDAKYGRQLQAAFTQPNGELLRICIDELSNSAYQRLLRLPPSELRDWLPRKSRYPHELTRLLDRWDDAQLHDVFWNLGGHDVDELASALQRASQHGGPAVILAFTLKGWRLPTVGHPQNHSVLLTDEQMESLRNELEIPADQTWSQFDPDTPEGAWCDECSARLGRNRTRAIRPPPGETAKKEISLVEQPATGFLASDNAAHASRLAALPMKQELSTPYLGVRSTQQTFGAILSGLSRECPEVAERVVTVSPDVASSTNLGGWINKHDVWNVTPQESLPPDQTAGILHWVESAGGRHIELGISENNLFLMLGQLGLAHELFGQLLLPIGTLYDPFIRRGLDALFYSVYSGAKFIVVGTPSGITLCPEGGIHQSLMTPSIGIELPEVAAYEPCFARELEWIMMDALQHVMRRERSTYLRLTTRRIDQRLFPDCAEAGQREQLRRQVLAGAYRLRDARQTPGYAPGQNVVHLFASGAVLPEALAAHDQLRQEGILVNVFNVTGPGPLYARFQQLTHAAIQAGSSETEPLEELVALPERKAPVVTLSDSHPHGLAWIGSALGARVWPLGVNRFGQSGSLGDMYREYRIDSESVAAACRHAVSHARLANRGAVHSQKNTV